MTTIAIASRRADGDLRICLTSCEEYASEWPVAISTPSHVVSANFASEFDSVQYRFTYPNKSFGEAYSYLADNIDDDLIILNDDAVLTPDTIPLLLEDVETARTFSASEGARLGLLGTRSNYIRGTQRAYGPGESLAVVDAVSPVCAYISHEALDDVVWPPINWWSDDLICWDLANLGYSHFVSRAYVHHVGERTQRSNGESHADLQREAAGWLQVHRPDFWEHLQTA